MKIFSHSVEKTLHEDPVIPLLGIYSKDVQSYHKDMCSTVFIAALFVINRTWKHLECPWRSEKSVKDHRRGISTERR